MAVIFHVIPIRTHIITEKDDLIQLVKRYTEGIA
ncbi:MAG TPA: F420-0:Gamma-glutamyl ligase, partial [Desulfotomaculum sp.]|nr:F420-0:Gamma-glutamyl ligase [Desulfotomaculum sp.]